MPTTAVFEIVSPTLPPGESAVVSLRGVEEMSRPYRFDVTFRCSAERSADLVRSLMGERVQLFLHGESTRVVHGVVSRLELSRVHDAANERVWRARVVPAFALLRRTKRSRIFQDMSVPAIIGEVLSGKQREGAFGVKAAPPRIEHRFDLFGTYAQRNYCVQYQESDFEFVSRLLSEEGIFYRFSHEQGAAEERMVMADKPELLPMISGDPALAHREAGSSQAEDDDILGFQLSSRVRAGRVEMRDYDFRRPMRWEPGIAEAPPAPGAFDERSLEVYDHQGEFEEFNPANASAGLRLSQLRARTEVASGESRCRRLVPGHVFELTSVVLPELQDKYTIVRVEHEGWSPEATRVVRDGEVYKNRFRAVPASVAPRPDRRPRRVQQSTETATVVGPAGKEIHTDEHGRIRVRFHWDREGSGPDPSCWIRTVQTWSGPGWGAQFIPRVGMEVVVLFVGGDVDKPLVVGCVPNVTNPVPFPLPLNRSKSGIRSDSTPGGGGYNEISFEDRAGYEQIHMHAQKDLDVEIRNDHLERVARNATQKVGQHSFLVVGANRLETTGADRTLVVGGSERTVTEHDRSDLVRGSEQRVVEGTASRRFQEDLHVAIGGRAEHDLKGPLSFAGNDDVVARVAGSLVTVVGTADKPRSIAVHAEGSVEVSGSKEVTVRSDTAVNLQCGDSLVRVTPEGVEIVASSIVLRASGASAHLGDDKALVLAKSSACLKSDDKVALFSSAAHVVLGSDAKIDGSEVKLKAPASPGDDPTSNAPVTTHIELVDDEGNPVPNERFRVHLSGGREISGVLDEHGKADVSFEGEGRIEFPDLGGVAPD